MLMLRTVSFPINWLPSFFIVEHSRSLMVSRNLLRIILLSKSFWATKIYYVLLICLKKSIMWAPTSTLRLTFCAHFSCRHPLGISKRRYLIHMMRLRTKEDFLKKLPWRSLCKRFYKALVDRSRIRSISFNQSL
jgi:hypothetical protein